LLRDISLTAYFHIETSEVPPFIQVEFDKLSRFVNQTISNGPIDERSIELSAIGCWEADEFMHTRLGGLLSVSPLSVSDFREFFPWLQNYPERYGFTASTVRLSGLMTITDSIKVEPRSNEEFGIYISGRHIDTTNLGFEDNPLWKFAKMFAFIGMLELGNTYQYLKQIKMTPDPSLGVLIADSMISAGSALQLYRKMQEHLALVHERDAAYLYRMNLINELEAANKKVAKEKNNRSSAGLRSLWKNLEPQIIQKFVQYDIDKDADEFSTTHDQVLREICNLSNGLTLTKPTYNRWYRTYCKTGKIFK